MGGWSWHCVLEVLFPKIRLVGVLDWVGACLVPVSPERRLSDRSVRGPVQCAY